MSAALERITRAFYAALRPPAKLRLSEWADRYAMLSSESAANPGRWKTIPYQRGIMDAFTDPRCEQVTCIKSARIGWTKIVNNVAGFFIHQDPCTMGIVQPTDSDAESYSKEEIAPMIRDTPVLSERVTEAKSRDSGNTILQKLFPGGLLALIGANSPRGFRRVSRRVMLFDETDGYPASAGTEGDPVKLGIKRTEYYYNRKIGAGSTPTTKGFSRIEKLWQQSDQRRYFVPCPVCDCPQVLQWKNFRYKDSAGEPDPEGSHFICEDNGCKIEHAKKRWMVEEADRRQLADPNCGYGWIATNPDATASRHWGFHIWAAYSFSPNATWAHMAREWIEAQGDKEQLKVFINTWLGELWEDEFQAKVGAEALKARAETYDPAIVPAGAVILVAGVDVQDNRLEVGLYGVGRNEEIWQVSHEALYGDPAQPEVWEQLDKALLRSWRHGKGGMIKLAAAGVDSGGHYTHEVYQYCRERQKHGIFALKGASARKKPPISKPTKQDVNFRGQVLKDGVQLFSVGTDTIKTTLYSRFKLEAVGAQYIHFNAASPLEFFEQLTVERLVTRYVKGFPVREWMKPDGKRNEALDCLVYAYAAFQSLYMRYHRAALFDIFEKRLTDADKPAAENAPGGAQEKKGGQQEAIGLTIPPNSQKGFVNSW
jgi:phage terminase large subunit GpA-like protein